MYIYLYADADNLYKYSAYSYIVSNFPVQSNRHLDWTVVEAYLHGFLELSNFIIKKRLHQQVTCFTFCTSSSYLKRLLTTDYLDLLSNNSWKSLDGKYLFYQNLLKELHYHLVFYKERNVNWECISELTATEYVQYERCIDAVNCILKGE